MIYLTVRLVGCVPKGYMKDSMEKKLLLAMTRPNLGRGYEGKCGYEGKYLHQL
jgi:hypothetical protein